ncbi:DUF881 domain-containing protein [Microlunatus antarcticus]|uniref:Uncharacterized protein YlxW (UPF0749 family) n=1 Tax=Microlunatus antarcticus TaxID=53388 RepID=A0A7W5P6R9_9ACTN|nr:DUF881 domain-containing protein [Microlunatus antarcticus]MBB3326794.1 uncharacterized protein YlxW (UPF0749 family) [Microlunatus antarcticus]
MRERRPPGRRVGSRRLAALARSRDRIAGDEPDRSGTDPSRAGDRDDAAGPRPGVWRRIGRAALRPGRSQVAAAVVLCLLGMAGVVQIRANDAGDTYSNARREDLVQILDGLGVESRRLESEVAELQGTKARLESGADSQRVARDDAQQRVDELAILAGTAPARGSGIRMRISDPQGKVGADVVLDAVEEMRDAGAEVIDVNGQARVVASTWFGDDGSTLVVDGISVTRPLTISVIGDPHSLEEAARFRGGIVSEITGPKIGGDVQIDQSDDVVVTSLHAPPASQYARPASSGPTPR